MREGGALRLVVGTVAAMLLAAGCASEGDQVFYASATDLSSSATRVVGGGSNPEPGARPRHGGKVVVGILTVPREPGSLNRLAVAGDWTAHMITNGMLDPIVDVSQKNVWLPRLATRVPTFANGDVKLTRSGGMTVEFDIHATAHWSDGHPITCRDQRFTWKTMMNPRFEAGGRGLWDVISDVKCDPRRPKHVLIEYPKPFGWYLETLRISPMPEHDFRGKDVNQHWADQMPVTSGPFKFGEYRRGVGLTIVRDDDYWNAGPKDLPYLDAVEFRFFKDRNTMNIQLSGGEIDMINPALEASEDEERSTFPKNELKLTPGTAVEVLGFNTRRGPTKDVRVRQALAYAIDRELLIDHLLHEPFHFYDSLAIPEQGRLAEPAWKGYRPDPKQVAQLLEAAGYTRGEKFWEKDGRRLKLLFKAPLDRVLRMRASQLLQQELRKQGIDLEIQLEDGAVFWGQSMADRSFHIAMRPIGTPVAPDQFVNFVHDEETNRQNNWDYRSAEVTRLFDAAKATLDIDERDAKILELQRIIARDAVVLPLYQHIDELAHHPRVRGTSPNPQTSFTWNVDHWWVDE